MHPRTGTVRCSFWFKAVALVVIVVVQLKATRFSDLTSLIPLVVVQKEGNELVDLGDNITTAAVQASNASTDPTSSNNGDEKYDLIFWYKPNVSLPESTFLVSRNPFSENPLTPAGGLDVLRVDFRTCGEPGMTCSNFVDQDTTAANIQEDWRYQHFRNHKLTLHYEIPKQLDGWESKGDIQDLFQDVTYWSTLLDRHVSVLQALDSIALEECLGGICPEPCPENVQQGPSPYPYIRDLKDGICKSIHPKALPPKRPFGGRCNCKSTCYTPQVGDPQSYWPWADETEYNLYNSKSLSDRDKSCTRGQRMTQQYQERFLCPKELNRTDLPCPLRIATGGTTLLFIPKAKLIFCGIPKGGITEWSKFFRHVLGARDYLSYPFHKQDRRQFFMNRLSSQQTKSLLSDPSWTKAVIVRNPYERLLSAYMDKIVEKGKTQQVFKVGNKHDPNPPVLTFEEFVDRVTATRNSTTAGGCDDPNGLHGCTNKHWAPQTMLCGLDYLLPNFDFVGNFDHVAEHTKILLEKVGLWEEYGATFDDGGNMQAKDNNSSNFCAIPPMQRNANETNYGFNQKGPSESYSHATNSKSRFEEMYTPELLAKVRGAYHLDFAVWDAISQESLPPHQVLRGMDIPMVQDKCNGR